MSEILRVVERRGPCLPPVLLVRCPFCHRVYQTAQWPKKARNQVRCIACKRPRGHAARDAGILDGLVRRVVGPGGGL